MRLIKFWILFVSAFLLFTIIATLQYPSKLNLLEADTLQPKSAVNVSMGSDTAEFPFGYYGLEYPTVLNTQFSPRVYIDSSMSAEDISEVTALAQSGGVQVYQYLPTGILALPLAQAKSEWIDTAVSYPKDIIAGFYVAEEPSQNEISGMIDMLNLIHETDPLQRPVTTYLGYFNISNIIKFRDTVDINFLGAYPQFKGYPQGLMTGVMDSGRQAMWPVGKRFYAVPETFGPILEHADGPLLLRNNTYQGVIGGADGVIFYEESGFDGAQYPAFKAELDNLAEEFVGSGHMGAVVLSPDPPQTVTHTILSGPTSLIQFDQFEYTRYYERMQYRLEVYEGDIYLLATNIGGNAVTVQFDNVPSSDSQISVEFESRTIALSSNSFQDSFDPYEVHVYKATADLPSGFVLDVTSPTRGLITNTPNLSVTGTITPVSTVTVDGLAATVAPDGTFSRAHTLTEGDQMLTIASSSTTITRAVTLDTIPPNTIITNSEGENVSPFTFWYEGQDSGSGVQFYSYRIDNGEWSLWTTAEIADFRGAFFDDLNLTTGTHTFSVRARDRAFNIDPTPAQISFEVIETEVPASPAISAPSIGQTDQSQSFSVSANDPDGDQISYRLFWDDGTNSEWTSLMPSDTAVLIQHSWDEGGTYNVRVQAKDEHGKTIPWSDTPFHQIKITGLISRSIPFGYYGLEYPTVQNSTFTPRVHIDSGMKPEDMSEVIDLAKSGGVEVYQYLPPGVFSMSIPEIQTEWLEPAFLEPISVIAGVYPSEEPGASEIPAMIDLLNLVHEVDPHNRPVVTYLGYFNISNIEQFRETVDIDLLGAYPVFKGFPQGLMTGAMDSGRQALWPEGKRFYTVPETFGPILEHADGPLLLRNNTYQGVIGGADGIIFYEESGFDGVEYPTFKAELNKLKDEFIGSGGLGQIILSPDPPQVVTHTITVGSDTPIMLDQFEYVRYYEPIQYHLEAYQGEVYLFVANISDETVTVEFQDFPTESTSATVLFEDRTVAILNTTFQDIFDPYEVHIYKTAGKEPLYAYLPIILR